jgi:hypothetical protein
VSEKHFDRRMRMLATNVKRFIIDVDSSKTGKFLKRSLLKLKSTISVEDPVNYVFGTVQNECQLRIETLWNEEELENWLYNKKMGHMEYLGIVEI